MATQYLDKTGLELLISNIKAEDKKILDLIGTVPDSVGDVKTPTVIRYVDAKSAAVAENAASTAINALSGSASQTASSSNGQLALSVKTSGGKVTEVTGSIAANTYAAYEYETKVNTLIGDDSSKSVRTIANEELAAQLIPSEAKESLNTLQEIAAWIQTHPDDASTMNNTISALQNQVGKAAEGNNKATGLVARIDSLEGAVGENGSVSTQISTAIGKLDASVGSTTVASNKHVAVQVVETNGVLTDLTVTESDIASAQALTALTNTVGFTAGTGEKDPKTVVAYVDTEINKAKNGNVASATKATQDASGNVITTTYATKAEIAALDNTVRSNMDNNDAVSASDKVGVKLIQTDGKIESILVKTNNIASATYVGTIPTIGNITPTTVVGYVDAKVAAASAEITAIPSADITSLFTKDTTANS